MKKNLLIIGTGLFAEVAASYFEDSTDYRVIGFACHARYKHSNTIYGRPLTAIEELSDDQSPANTAIFIAIGYAKMNKIRQAVYEEMKAKGYHCASFVYPNVKIWNSTTVGENVFIFEDNTIQPFTHIGNNTMLWSGNHIGHHSRIGDHCFIASHAVISGSCAIGNNVFIGVNATLRDSIYIADETLIGAGALIMKDTAHKAVYAPQPTKLFAKNSEELRF